MPLIFYGETPSDYGTELGDEKNFPQILRIRISFTMDQVIQLN